MSDFDLLGDPIKKPSLGILADRFGGVPPFSVLNARESEWQDRKRKWLALGLRSEVGREENLLKFSDTVRLKGVSGNDAERQSSGVESGTSIFDPVLCELAYRWWSPPGGLVLDPFAGGAVRGVVAGVLNRRYLGIDLRQEQVTANEIQRDTILSGEQASAVRWICGDSKEEAIRSPMCDFVFSCPPYGDLEVYSRDPKDLSHVAKRDFARFVLDYRQIIENACARLHHNRFAAFVVGDFRDASGIYRDFVSTTIAAFRSAGLRYYNEGILVTSVGSLPMRMSGQFNGGRKLGKTHQNLVVFVKGDWEQAAKKCEQL